MPRLVFVLDESMSLPRRLVDSDRAAIQGFRHRRRSAGVIVKAVRTPDQLGEAVLHALYEERLRRLGGLPAASRRRPWMAPPLERMVERPEWSGRLVAALMVPGASEVGLTTALHAAKISDLKIVLSGRRGWSEVDGRFVRVARSARIDGIGR